MGPLLVVLVAACALTSAGYIGRGLWARTRSVERHQQALDILGDITQSNEPAQEAKHGGLDHQAHVRVIGPEGHILTEQGALPPPRPFSRPAQGGPSPLRRPSRSAPSAAAIDAVTASATLGGSSGAKLVRTRQLPQPPAGPAADSRTQPVLAGGEPPTRPVPALQPQVFRFDDLSGRVEALAGEQPPAPAPPVPTPNGASTTGPSAAAPSTGPAPAVTSPSLADAAQGARRRPLLPRLLAAAAIVVVVGVAATAVVILQAPSHQADGGARVAARHIPSTTVPKPVERATTTTVRGTTTTAPAPPTTPALARPAVLVGAAAGTATYQLTSPSASIVVSASGPCWIEVRVGGQSGQVIYEGTLQKGGVSKVTGPAWIRLGDPPYVHITVDGSHMSVPGATLAEPLNLQFTLG